LNHFLKRFALNERKVDFDGGRDLLTPGRETNPSDFFQTY